MIYCENCRQNNNRSLSSADRLPATSTVLLAACHFCHQLLPCYSDQPIAGASTMGTELPQPPANFNEMLRDQVKDASFDERKELMGQYADNIGAALMNVFNITLGAYDCGFYIKWMTDPKTGARGIVLVALSDSAAAIQQLLHNNLNTEKISDGADEIFNDDIIQ